MCMAIPALTMTREGSRPAARQTTTVPSFSLAVGRRAWTLQPVATLGA